jgi:phytoene dehydrogenase-like protein
MERSVSIVGGGLAGLTAAIYAAKDGARVTLHERVSELGGRARTHADGEFRFNMGPHALYANAAARAVLNEIGVEPLGSAPALGGAAARYGGQLYAMPGGFVSLLTTGLLGPGEKLEAAKVLASLPKLDASRFDGVPLRHALEQLARHAKVRELLAALVRLSSYSNAVDSMCAGSALRRVQTAFAGGVLYLHGGWGRLVAALREAALEQGVDIRTGSKVDAVRGAAGVFEVISGGRAERHDAVVLAVPPGAARELVAGEPGPAPDALAHWCDALVPVRAACLELGLAKLSRPKNTFALGIDEPTYFSVHSAAASDLAPAGGALIHCARYLAPKEQPDRAELQAQLESLVDAMQPGWREHVRSQRLLTELVVVNALLSVDLGGEAGRPGPAVPGCAGLFVAGDWVGPRGQLADASFASGRAAGKAVATA